MKLILACSLAAMMAAPAIAQTQTPPTLPPGAEMQPADPSVPRDAMAPVGSPQNPVVVGGNMTAPPPAPKDYPMCSKTVQDSCQNPGEGPRRGKKRWG
ncbi:MAG: hypothetical protein U5M50_13210 [Sphingobium sp.]|nr:hypothetical protein [Sphingobium sp.]